MEITKEQFREFRNLIHRQWDLYFEIMHMNNSLETKSDNSITRAFDSSPDKKV